MMNHKFEQIRRTSRRPIARRTVPAVRPETANAGQLTASELRTEVLALLG